MGRRWVVNASPVIVLGKLGQLRLLTQLTDELVIPAGVATEIAAGPVDDAGATWIESVKNDLVHGPVDVDPVVAAWELGMGESEVISYARQHKDYDVVIDDAAARNCARSVGLRIRGTLGVIVLARQEGLLDAAGPLLRQMPAAGLHIHPRLLAEAMRLAGEEPTQDS